MQSFLFALLVISILATVSWAENEPQVPPRRIESNKYRYVGIVNASPQYIVAKYLTGCIYIYRGNGRMILYKMREDDKYDHAKGFGFAITDYDFADRTFYNLKENITGISVLGQFDTCDSFFETHVKGTVSFGTTENIFTSGYEIFNEQLIKYGFLAYGARPALNQWEKGAEYPSGAISLSKIMVLFSSMAIFALL